ncbi:MAG: ester cyclase [Pseudomonadota bacterium]
MDAISDAKVTVRSWYAELDAPRGDLGAVMSRHISATYVWRGFHPFNKLDSADQVARMFWLPLRQSLTAMQRRQDIFFAGLNSLNDDPGVWVVSMGHLMGVFDVPFLGIPPTGKLVMLRYCEFNRVEGGKITETAMFFDLPHLAAQAGSPLFSRQSAAQLMQPGPMTQDGLLYGPQPADEGKETLALIDRMIGDLGQWRSGLPLEEELRLTWAEDMVWWGPTGIGATFTIPRYVRQHSGPFRAAFSDRSKTTHIARLAEGHYGGFFGWPNFSARLTGTFMGTPATGEIGEFRVIDIYRRMGNRLAENWVFIDLLHFWKCQGVDLLERLQKHEPA